MTASTEWDATEPVGHDHLLPLDMAPNINDERVLNRVEWVDGLGRAYALALSEAIDA
jgi:hypothetical protein